MNPYLRSWIIGDIEWLAKSQVNENIWGRALTDKKDSWSGQLGEKLIQTFFPDGWKPSRLNGHKLDWETPEFIIEVKSETYHTPGTASEKILGVPIKYRNVPDLYSKPLLIVCFGYAEQTLMFSEPDPKLSHIIDLWRSMNIHFVKGSRVLQLFETRGSLNGLLDELVHPSHVQSLREPAPCQSST